ncbi:hypothetical protein A6R68_05397, partial [Neotoma lepida]
ISCMKDPFVEMEIYCYNVSALLWCGSSLFIFVSVSWNHFVDHYGQTTLDFPPYFPVNKEALISKYCTVVFPLGVLTAAISFFGAVIFLSKISILRLQSQMKAQFNNGKGCIFKLSGLLSSLLALVFEIVIARSLCWHLWGFDHNIVQFVPFGLWKAHYPQEFNVSRTTIKMLVHTSINSTWTISPEF